MNNEKFSQGSIQRYTKGDKIFGGRYYVLDSPNRWIHFSILNNFDKNRELGLTKHIVNNMYLLTYDVSGSRFTFYIPAAAGEYKSDFHRLCSYKDFIYLLQNY